MLRIRQQIVQAVGSTPLRFGEIIRHCRGAYPTTVAGALKILEPKLVTDTAKTFTAFAHEERSPTIPGSRLSEIEGNPVLSSWYFTLESCRRIEKLRDWSQAHIAFLGTPRLYEWFASRRIGRSRLLIELDSLVVSSLRELDTQGNEVIQHDIHTNIPENLRGRVDFVIFDPPWYPGEYEIWIDRATRLAHGGTLCFSLFPELTRPEAPAQREHILAYLKERANSVCCISDCLEYEIPSFERQQLVASGIIGLGPWKLSDLILCRVSDPVGVTDEAEFLPTAANWTEIDIGKLRIFVNLDGNFESRLSFVRCATDNSIVLPSPSHRDEAHSAANVLTSRGHGLICSEPGTLVHILENCRLAHAEGTPVYHEVEKLTIDSPSKSLLKSLLS